MILRIASKGDLYGLKDARTNKVVVKPQYRKISLIRKMPRLYRVEDENEEVGIISGNTGKVIIPLEYEHVSFYYPRWLELYGPGGKVGVATLSGKVLIPPKYEYFVYNKIHDVFVVNQKAAFGEGVVDANGKLIVPEKYMDIYLTPRGIEVTTAKDKAGVFSYSGKVIVPTIFDSVVQAPERYYVRGVSKNKVINFKVVKRELASDHRTIKDIFSAA